MTDQKHIWLAKPASSPFNPILVSQDSSLALELHSSASPTKIELCVDGQDHLDFSATSNKSSFIFESNETGIHVLEFTAFSDEQILDVVRQEVFVVPESRVENLPWSKEDGVHFIDYPESDKESLLFILSAPGKKFVHLIGEFNSWRVAESYQLRIDREKGFERFWIEIPKPKSHGEIAFQYLVDGEIRIADPFSKKVLDPTDSEIPRKAYPRLKKYPRDKTEEIVSVIELGAPSFDWTDDDYSIPNTESLVIYEVLLRDFTQNGDFKSASALLPYLKSLGVNVVELMPVFEFEDNGSWGYNTTFYFALDRSYGPAEELKGFINAAHELGIAVIFDIVFNHNFGQSPLVRLYNEGRYGPPTLDNPWFNTFPTHDFNVGYDFNHESLFTQDLVRRALLFWMDEFHVDGYRFDLSKGFTQKQTIGDMGAWAGYDSERIDRIKWMADLVWEKNSKAILILEHFTNNDEEYELAHYGVEEGFSGFLLWNNLNSKMGEAVMGYNDGDRSVLNSAYHHDRGWKRANLVNYLESHDHGRLVESIRNYGNEDPGHYNCKDWRIALNRMKLAAVFFLSTPGPKMIWQFGELGHDQGSPLDSRLDGWIGLDQMRSVPERRLLKETIAALIELRKNEDIFTSSDTSITQETHGDFKYMILRGDWMTALVIGNFGVEKRQRSIDVYHKGVWYDFFTGDSVDLRDQENIFKLEPGGFHILTTRPVFTPSQDLLIWQTENGPNVYSGTNPITIDHTVNYYTQRLQVRYDLNQPLPVKVGLFTRDGLRLVSILESSRSGSRRRGLISWRIPKELKNGLYLLRFEMGDRRITRRVYFNR